VDAARSVSTSAVAEGDLAALEVAEELLPLGVGGRAVLFCRAQLAAAGEERPVTCNYLLRVDRLWRSQISELSE
jgi:hypothetical protein